jgi:hypothetical protein
LRKDSKKDSKMERWKSIKGFEGLYKISSDGRVKSLERKLFDSKRKIALRGITTSYLKPALSGGYLMVNLYKNGVRTKAKIHLLVGNHFVEGYFSGAIINHIDGIKINNFYNNLEWTTRQGNMIHARDNGLLNIHERVARNKAKKVKKEKENRYTCFNNRIYNTETGYVYSNIDEAAKIFNLQKNELRLILLITQKNKTTLRLK